MQTDLVMTFDTVDYFILLEKLCQYQIDGKENNLTKYILENRLQYVEIDRFVSDTLAANPCLVL